MKAYHFLRNDMTAGQGIEPAWTIGEERTYIGKIEICHSGYHSSPSWYDALQYAPGGMACIVEVSEPEDRQSDKYVSRARKLICARNAEKVLRTFACDRAERALKSTKVVDEHSWNAIKVARLYNEGKATTDELAAARADAMDAAWATALAEAMDAARVAALADTMDAARAATRVAARVAARAAALAAALADTMDAARVATRVAARAAALAAALADTMDAEIKCQKQYLNELMEELFVS